MIDIQIADNLAETGLAEVKEDLLREAARRTLDYTDTSSEADLTIVLTDDAQIQALNQQFLDIDAPTDVLAFPAGEDDPDSDAFYLGDVIISLPTAIQQAQAGNHPVEDELQLLVVHGVLHLLGYDHAEEEERRIMWAKQAEILDSLDVRIAPD